MGTVVNINEIIERFSTQKEFKRIDPFKLDFGKPICDDTDLMSIIKKYRKFSDYDGYDFLAEMQRRVIRVPALSSLIDKTNKQ